MPTSRFVPSSVRVRITAVATVVVALALALGAVLLLQTVETALSNNEDDAAISRAHDLATVAAHGSLPRRLASVGDDSFIQVVDKGRVVRASTPNVATRSAIFSFRPHGEAPSARTLRNIRDDKDLEDYRVWALATDTPSGPATVYVANSLEIVSETVAVVRNLLFAGLPFVVALLAFVTWVVVGRALRPVEAIRAQVAGISDAGADGRVPVPTGRDEIAQLANTMNEMLDRLERSSARQRAFAADASHELLSPLARIRTQLEVVLAGSGPADWQEVATALLADGAEMEQLVRDLLFLAQEDEGSGEPVPTGMVDLDVVVLEEAARVRVASTREVDTSKVSAAPVRGSREQLRRLVRNLLENAVRYAATRVQVTLASGPEAVELVVRDDGPGVPDDQRQRIFDRFVRLDDARSRETGGGGLGLPIVQTIARRHGGTVQLVRIAECEAGATFVLRLPVPLNVK